MDFNALLYTFILLSIAELGDKTQLVTIALSCKYERKRTFLSAFLALSSMALISSFSGFVASKFIPMDVLKFLTYSVFIVIGLYLFLERGDDSPVECYDDGGMSKVFLTVFLMELGDKTQIAVMSLASSFDPISVFIGSSLAFALIVALGVFAGALVVRFLGEKKVKKFSALLFITVGILGFIGIIFESYLP
ncbi:MAG: TMEM165/GDT1 family protein [Candidatus Asgardarchaeia archaeon]